MLVKPDRALFAFDGVNRYHGVHGYEQGSLPLGPGLFLLMGALPVPCAGFGASSSPFGTTSPSPFGQQAPAFGQTSPFGATASAFGQVQLRRLKSHVVCWLLGSLHIWQLQRCSEQK